MIARAPTDFDPENASDMLPALKSPVRRENSMENVRQDALTHQFHVASAQEGVSSRATAARGAAGYDEQAARLSPRSPKNPDDALPPGVDPQAMANRMVDVMELVNNGSLGVYYRTNSLPAPINRLPDKQARMGYANSRFFYQPGEKGGQRFRFYVREGMSHAAALQAWLSGPTVADCKTTLIAIQLDAVRNEVGNGAFDKMLTHFAGPLISAMERDTPLGMFMSPSLGSRTGKTGMVGARPAEPGERHYFANHPQYIMKHPDGLWSGENVIYGGLKGNGEQRWIGFGADHTEPEMLTLLLQAYNAPRSQGDYQKIVMKFAPSKAPPDGDWEAAYQRTIPTLRKTAEGRANLEGAFADGLANEQELMRAGGGIDVTKGWSIDPRKIDAALKR